MNTRVFPVPTGLTVQEIMFTHARRLAPIEAIAGFAYDPVAGTLTLTLRDNVELIAEIIRREGGPSPQAVRLARIETKLDDLITSLGDDDANPVTPTILQRLKSLFVKNAV